MTGKEKTKPEVSALPHWLKYAISAAVVMLALYFIWAAMLWVASLYPPPETTPDLLDTKIDFEWNGSDLEAAAKDLTSLLLDQPRPIACQVLTRDLELSGITRDARVRELKYKGRSVRDVLNAMVVDAQPGLAKAPDHPERKLIWVLGQDPDDPDRTCVLITTRAAAKKRGDKIPDEFRIK